MRKFLFLVGVLLTLSALATAQATPADQTTTTPSATAAQDPARPQNAMPPDQVDTSAPPPNPGVQEQSAEPAHLPGGAEIRATLDTPLSTKTSRPGDRFSATITQPVRDLNGNVVVPIGAKINGQITEADDNKTNAAVRDMGHLNLRFTDVQLPNGSDIPLNATLMSVHTLKTTASTTRPAANQAAVGAGVGTVGAPVGFGPPLRGLAVGTFTGGGYVLATNGKRVDLPAQTGFRLRVDRNTPVPNGRGL
jgi:hypothetical protein